MAMISTGTTDEQVVLFSVCATERDWASPAARSLSPQQDQKKQSWANVKIYIFVLDPPLSSQGPSLSKQRTDTEIDMSLAYFESYTTHLTQLLRQQMQS